MYRAVKIYLRVHASFQSVRTWINDDKRGHKIMVSRKNAAGFPHTNPIDIWLPHPN